MSKDPVSRARSVVSVNALVIAALALGLVSNIIIAALFGLSHRVDAFFAAAVLPSLFMSLCIDFLGKNFLPVLASARAISAACADSVTSSIVTIVTVLSACVTAALIVFSGLLFDTLLPGFDEESLDLVNRYFLIMAPSIVLMAVNTFHEYVWQYEERFTYVSMSRAALPAANLLALLVLSPWLGEYCLPIGYLAGHAAMFFVLVRNIPYRYRLQMAMRPGFERRVFGNSAIVMSTGIIARSRSVIMNYLGSQLGSGAISALALASKLTDPLERSAFTGIRMFMFSDTVRLVVADDRRGLAALYGAGLRAAFLVLAPLLWWIGFHSEPIVRLFFLRGEFTQEMSAVVAAVLVGLVPSVLFVGVNHLLSNAFYAMNRIAVPALVMPAGTLLYAAAAIPLAAFLGTQGLAIASSVASVAVFVAMLLALARRVPELGVARLAGELSVYAALAGATIAAISAALGRFDLPPLASAAAALPLGLAAYAGTLHLMGDRTLAALRELARAYGTYGLAINVDRSSKEPRARKSD